MTEFSELRSRLAGQLFTPADEGYAEEAAGFNTAIVHGPEAVMGVATEADVVETVRFARAHALPVRVQATGHGAHAPIANGLLISTRRLDGVSVDAESRIATIGAGARWSAVVEAAADLGLAPITGSSTGVGAIGYLLGGGLGPLSRSHGFSSDYLRGVRIVTGAGHLVEANTEQNAELFWALRGGKGGLGVVTEARLELVPMPSLYAGSLFFRAEHVEGVLRAWAEWTADAPPEVTTSVVVIRYPDLEQVPAVFRGQTIAGLRFAYPGDAVSGARLAAPLRGIAPVYLDALQEIPARAIATIHNDRTEPGAGWASAQLLSHIDQDFVSTFLHNAGPDSAAPFIATEIRHLGGRVREDVPAGSAVGGRASGFALTLIGVPNPELFAETLPAATGAVFAALEPWIAEEGTINFVPAGATPAQFERSWSAESFARLAEVRRRHDPAGVFPYGVA